MIFVINPFSTGKIEKSIFEIPIIPQTLNIKNLRTTSARFINLHTIKKRIEYSSKKVLQGQSLVLSLLPFLRYCCPNVGRYYHPPSGVHGVKGLTTVISYFFFLGSLNSLKQMQYFSAVSRSLFNSFVSSVISYCENGSFNCLQNDFIFNMFQKLLYTVITTVYL